MGRTVEPMPDIVKEHCELPEGKKWSDLTSHRRRLLKEQAWRSSRGSSRTGKRRYIQNQKEEGECAECGEDRTVTLVFHHEYADEKVFSLANPTGHSLEQVKTEIEKCVLLCANCHMVEHYG